MCLVLKKNQREHCKVVKPFFEVGSPKKTSTTHVSQNSNPQTLGVLLLSELPELDPDWGDPTTKSVRLRFIDGFDWWDLTPLNQTTDSAENQQIGGREADNSGPFLLPMLAAQRNAFLRDPLFCAGFFLGSGLALGRRKDHLGMGSKQTSGLDLVHDRR